MYVSTRGLITGDILLALFLNASAEQQDITYYPPSSMVTLAGAKQYIADLRSEIDDIQADLGFGAKFTTMTVCGVTRTLNVTLLAERFDASEYDALYGTGAAQNAIATILQQKRKSSFIGADFAALSSPTNVSTGSLSPRSLYDSAAAFEDSLDTTPSVVRKKSLSSIGSAFTSRFNSLRSSGSLSSPPVSLFESAATSPSNSTPSSRVPSPTMGLLEDRTPSPVRRKSSISLPKMGFFAKPANKGH